MAKQLVSLLALSVIAAGVLAANSPEIAAGASFQAPPDIADKLIASNQAEKAPTAVETVKARVLIDGTYGRVNTVADVPVKDAKLAQADGQIDTTPEAVAYAESLAD